MRRARVRRRDSHRRRPKLDVIAPHFDESPQCSIAIRVPRSSTSVAAHVAGLSGGANGYDADADLCVATPHFFSAADMSEVDGAMASTDAEPRNRRVSSTGFVSPLVSMVKKVMVSDAVYANAPSHGPHRISVASMKPRQANTWPGLRRSPECSRAPSAFPFSFVCRPRGGPIGSAQEGLPPREPPRAPEPLDAMKPHRDNAARARAPATEGNRDRAVQ